MSQTGNIKCSNELVNKPNTIFIALIRGLIFCRKAKRVGRQRQHPLVFSNL